MKKLLIATAALAMVAGTAQAQSSVTVYGSYDLGYVSSEYTNIGGSVANTAQRQVSGINSGGAAGNGALTSNRIGFRGTEDIGGGITAGFNLEYGFGGAATGNDALAAVDNSAAGSAATLSVTPRESKVSIGSPKLGRVEVGYGTTGLHATAAGHRAISGSNFVGDVSYASDSVSGVDSRIHLNAVRMNGVTYKSPVLSGFDVRVDAGNDRDRIDSGSTDTAAQNLGITVNYSAGALKLAATNHVYRHNTAAAVKAKKTYNAASAQYTLGNIVLDALYATNDTETVGGVQVSKNSVTQAGVKYNMGNITFAAQYGMGEGEGAAAETDQRERSGYQVAAIYNLSKRTNVYAIYGAQEMKYVTTTNAGNKEEAKAYGFGIRHSF
jgi:predicted porin